MYLAALNQVPAERSGVIGRLTDIKNGITTHYDAGNGLPRRISVRQRHGFASLATTGHNSDTGVTETVAWANPELLSSLGDQLLSIANAIPRVYDETDWTHYSAERVVTNQLSETVWHTSQRTINVDDQATKEGVTCSVWTERPDPQTTRCIVYVGFRSSDGTWVRTPQVLFDPEAVSIFVTSNARVIADDEDDFFWVIYNKLDNFHVVLYDLNGRQIDADQTARLNTAWNRFNWWDITPLHGGGCLFAQPVTVDTDDGVSFTSFSQTAGSISAITFVDADIHCIGPLAFVTNDIDDAGYYLATIGMGDEPSGRLWGYQIVAPVGLGFEHEYDFNVQPATDTTVDSLIGFIRVNNDPDNFDGTPDMIVSFTSMQDDGTLQGPPFDPQFRYSEVWSCDFADNETFIRQNDYTCQVSRAFLHDDEYYSINYYQSGSGNTITSTQVEAEFVGGDYMIGAPIQPLTVVSGDGTTGALKSYPSSSLIINSGAVAAVNVQAGDTVALVVSDGVDPNNLSFPFAPAGTPLLRWQFANAMSPPPSIGGKATLAATTGVAGANQTFDVIGPDEADPTHVFYTGTTGSLGASVIPGTFNLAGTVTRLSQTFYRLADLPLDYTVATSQFLIGGDMVVTGNSTGANNGTKTIRRVGIDPEFAIFNTHFGNPGIWIDTGSEVDSSSDFAATVEPLNPTIWTLSQESFDTSYEGANLLVEDDDKPENNIDLDISDVPSSTKLEVDTALASTAEIFGGSVSLPTMSIKLTDQIPYTFFLQDVDPDYTFLGALIVVSGDTVHPENNGVYQITDIDPVAANHILYAVPADGHTGQRNQNFIADDQLITIIFRTNVQPEFQPCWLMVPLTGTKPVVGRFEYGIAFADWRNEGASAFAPNVFPGMVTTPVRGDLGWLFMLPYRAVSFTVGQSLATANGQTINAAVASNQSTVGLKQFLLADVTGLATTSATQLMLPGPMCSEFTASGFHENGVNFGFEAPFIISQQVSAGDSGAGLRLKGTYQYQVVAEVTDEDGDRVFSIPSPPVQVRLVGDNNSVTLGGRMLQPLSSTGVPLTTHFGVTNRRLLGISIYRTAYQGDTPTTEHHKITLDLNVNGLAPVSDTNDSGFATLGEFTWTYLDENLDAAILPQEILYTDKGFLPRFPAPAQRQGTFWKNRSWVVGYDGAVWMSGEKTEGDAVWFFPLFRYVLPTTDKPVAVAGMDDYLIVLCSKSIWYIPAANFPNATGREGALPTPVQLPFTNGCTGHAITMREGVAYSSTAGGVWLITRSLLNAWLGQSIQDTVDATTPITAMTIDEKQRLHVAYGVGFLSVYDQVVQMWSSRWTLPLSTAEFLATVEGQVALQEQNRVWLADPLSFVDMFTGSPVAISLDVQTYVINFQNVRGLKAVWEMQLVGNYKGPHKLNAVISYPDDDPDNPTTFGPYTPDPALPYLLAINPMIEQASAYAVRVFASFEGIDVQTIGDTFELELISCEVGIDGTVGLNKFQTSRRIEGT